MGIDAVSFTQLVQLSQGFRPAGRSLMLGRQNYFYQREKRKNWRWKSVYCEDNFQNALNAAGLPFKAADLAQDDGFAEKLLRTLGFGEVESLDFSDFEAATLIWDLNTPVPRDWHNQFDFMFDGGTIEHVFNVPVAFQNVYDMLRVGGRFVAATPINGWPGHGIYQFGPEIVWSFWHRTKQCKVHRCMALSRDGSASLHMPDPAVLGKRTEWTDQLDQFPAGPVYMWYDVEKTTDLIKDQTAQQSDYVAKWETSDPVQALGLAGV